VSEIFSWTEIVWLSCLCSNTARFCYNLETVDFVKIVTYILRTHRSLVTNIINIFVQRKTGIKESNKRWNPMARSPISVGLIDKRATDRWIMHSAHSYDLGGEIIFVWKSENKYTVTKYVVTDRPKTLRWPLKCVQIIVLSQTNEGIKVRSVQKSLTWDAWKVSERYIARGNEIFF
jgi:hypothetical protein